MQSLSEDPHSIPSLRSCLRAGPDERRLCHEACGREGLTPPQSAANWTSVNQRRRGRQVQRERGEERERVGGRKEGWRKRGIKRRNSALHTYNLSWAIFLTLSCTLKNKSSPLFEERTLKNTPTPLFEEPHLSLSKRVGVSLSKNKQYIYK